MTLLFSTLLRFALLLIIVAGISYLAFGMEVVLITLIALLSCCLFWQFFYFIRLLNWLNNPQKSLQGWGIWGRLFEKIIALRKAGLKRKEALSASLVRFNRMVEAIPNGIIILTEGRIEWFNPLVCQHLNLNYHNDLGSILQNLIRMPEFQHFLQEKLEKKPLELRLNLQGDSGFNSVVQIARIPFNQKSELLITQDMTEKVRLDEAQIAFVANVSHELRTPLTVINGFVETLADMPDLPVEQRQHFLSLMQKEGQRMLNLLSDLLTVSRLERGYTDEKNIQNFNLSDLVNQVVEATKRMSQEQHQFVVEISPNIEFRGLSSELYSAFTNLTFNAVRYTPENGTITIKLIALENKQIKFLVEDTGVGIAAEHIPRLTERFYRVDNARSRETGGTGLGLAITKFIFAKYNTALNIESRLGRGSCFSVVLSKR
ncbi:phosphate regulon sensor histidine kinase PhoR [Rodentibacter rarus]|uniref:Phosphate regulon sensor protein PhoR n=1 Tax=Rodentibacter rarus TaxID=1908260 RepID=A0A1V3IMW6_9PAST|nr:phosphate regulon sensor histidine kinase PhoR [Rodentibacter rarus]OOF42019.1 phosphate regulon sensor histidine kinase PhoR [Rodentibacter rarus]OOF43553.1 phosphate regulon sensor histidine kinase PhoR [Rodentibacter rarus]